MIKSPYKYLVELEIERSRCKYIYKTYTIDKHTAIELVEYNKTRNWKVGGVIKATATLKDSRYKVIDKINLLD